MPLAAKTRTALLLAMALPLVLLIRVLRPLVTVRFGTLRSRRIGHFAVNTELYLCERDLSPSRWTFDIFSIPQPASNRQLERMWRRSLHVFPLARALRRANKWLPGHELHEALLPPPIDTRGLLRRAPVHLTFTPQEEHKGAIALRRTGVPDGSTFVCFNARESAYLEAVLPGRSWNYHNFRDSTVSNYMQAAEALTQRGHYAIRMGAAVRETLDTANLMIIDYATRHRTEFLDIYLPAKCRFFICDTAGLYAIAEVCRRPIAWVNYVPLDHIHTWIPGDLTIPKKLWLRDERRLLTFREIMESGAGRYMRSGQYERAGIDVIENTPEEITALVLEMDDRLNGTWETTEEDEELQRRFWSLFEGSELHGEIVSHIGAVYLRENRELLD